MHKHNPEGVCDAFHINSHDHRVIEIVFADLELKEIWGFMKPKKGVGVGCSGGPVLEVH